MNARQMVASLVLAGSALTPLVADAQMSEIPTGVCTANALTRWFLDLSGLDAPYTGDLVSASDKAYYRAMGGSAGCVEKFDAVIQYAHWYNSPQGSWQGAGYEDACNVEQPFLKFILAGDSLHHAVDYGTFGPVGGDGAMIRLEPAFHDSTRDYGPLTRGQKTTTCRGCDPALPARFPEVLTWRSLADLGGQFSNPPNSRD